MLSTDAGAFIAMTRQLLNDRLCGASTRVALGYLNQLFGARARGGVVVAVRAMDPAVLPAQVEGVCAAFVRSVRAAAL